jgi:hypothetical protein
MESCNSSVSGELRLICVIMANIFLKK